MALSDPKQVANLSRFFKTGKGQYGEGDQFLGIKVPYTRAAVRQHLSGTTMDDLERMIVSPYHEMRLAALLTLTSFCRKARKDPKALERYASFYLSHTPWINNWDLVDLSCMDVLGRWLEKGDRGLLYDLVGEGRTIWEKRIGVVTSMYFVRKGELDDAFRLVELLMERTPKMHDLLQKAAGWALRETGKKDMARLLEWLDGHAPTMPRTMLRYSLEKVEEPLRKDLMARK